VTPRPTPSAGPLIGGIVAGLVVGATVLTLTVFLVATTVLSSLHRDQVTPVFIVCYVIAIALGAGGLILGRSRSGFWTGLITGASVGMLGGTAICNLVIAGMSNGAMR
jgi:hypothetical protein